MTVAAAVLAEALRQVVPAASKDDARPILTGVLLVAHDGGAGWSRPTRTASPCAT